MKNKIMKKCNNVNQRNSTKNISNMEMKMDMTTIIIKSNK